MRTTGLEWSLSMLFLLCTPAFSFNFNSYSDLRTSLMNDNTNEYLNLPYQDQDKYTESGSALKVAVRVIIADGTQSATDDSLSVTAHLQAFWYDNRLSFNSSSPNNNYTLSKSVQNKLWTPGIYMEPEWTSQNEDTRAMRIFPNGLVAASRRIQTKIPCEVTAFYLKLYELECVSKITSYTMTSDEVDLIWRDPDPTVLTNTAIRQGKGEINSANPGACMWQAFQSLQSPCLEIKLHVTITYGLVFIRMYVPSFMAVMMAWSSFWIHRDEVSARIKLGTLVVWTMVTEFVTIGYTYPEYVRAPSGNVWMTACLSFTWLSFFLYIVVHVVRRREKAKVRQDMELEVKKKKEEKRTGERAFSISGIHPDGIDASKTVGYSVCERKIVTKWQLSMTSFQVDRLCRLWFGIAFGIFNIAFWVYYSVRRLV